MVNNPGNLRFMLHVSDFHLTENDNDIKIAKAALKEISTKLRSEKIKIDYLVHTGDIIDSNDFHERAFAFLKSADAETGSADSSFDFDDFCKNAERAEKVEFNKHLSNLTQTRFTKARTVISDFMSEINVAPGNVVICCGNHDAMRFAPLSDNEPYCEKTNNITYKSAETANYASDADCCKTFDETNPDHPKYQESFYHFNHFLNELKVANSAIRCKNSACNCGSPVSRCSLDNLNFLIINTNWRNPECVKPGNYCIHCRSTVAEMKDILSSKENASNELNIVSAHKPIYEICENTRLSYKNYRKTEFMSILYDYLGENGIYLCGDKHTRSVVGAAFHDVPHYISGEPLHVKNKETDDFEAEFNLLGIADGKLEMERKIHLWSKDGKEWTCDICPQDVTVSKLFDLSKDHISPSSYELIPATNSRNTWEALNQVLFSQQKAAPNTMDSHIDRNLIHACEITKDKELDLLFKAATKYRENGEKDIKWKKTDKSCTSTDADNIFVVVADRIAKRMLCNNRNVLNLRGKYSSGKSTFLGLLYIYLLRLYSIGKINFIPAYFALENKKMLDKAKDNTTYYDAVKSTFDDFTKRVQKIAKKEHQPICYILDRVDIQDCWSYSSEDSVGRGLLDILSRYQNAWYIFSFGDHNLPLFKNTMSTRIYSEDSDVMYFNPIDVRDENYNDPNDYFADFVSAFLAKKGFMRSIAKFCIDPEYREKVQYSSFVLDPDCANSANTLCHATELEILFHKLLPTDDSFRNFYDSLVSDVCKLIRKFRRLDLDFGFMRQHYQYLTELSLRNGIPCIKNNSKNVDETYSYYIDRQYERCLNRMGYGFVNYAPAMAFLFSYQGYTYERFRKLRNDSSLCERHDMKLICENEDKIYNAFMFIKKHQDAREYLTALYYHRELRFYTEQPLQRISDDSILNEYITRNIAVLIRKMWVDTNKFIIVCNKLLHREEISNCALSMLLYCLSHISIYEPKRIELLNDIRERAITALTRPIKSIPDQRIISADDTENFEDKLSVNFDSFWRVQGSNGKQKLDYFLSLSLLHTLVLYGAMGQEVLDKMMRQLYNEAPLESPFPENNTPEQIQTQDNDKALPFSDFSCYNRQHQMLYYQDLSIWGEHRKRVLNPGKDTIYKGLDFFNCLHYLCVKINDASRSGHDYPLLSYDVLTLCNLVHSRIVPNSDMTFRIYTNKNSSRDDSFFYWNKGFENVRPVIAYLDDTLDQYLKFRIKDSHVDSPNHAQFKYIRHVQSLIQERKKAIVKDLHLAAES